MKASELRIGNWVFNTSILKEMPTYPMMIAQLAEIEKRGEEHNMKGIPLTEEWLIKFGFEKSDATANVKTWSNHSLAINTYSREDEGYYWLRWYQHPKQSKIKYVHQLQNLYFALTGKELELIEEKV